MTIKHTPTSQFDDIPGGLPEGSVPKNADFASVAKITLELLKDFQKQHLARNAIWRDFLSFTDTFRTFYSIDTVFNTFQKLSQERKRSAFTLSDTAPRLFTVGESSWLDVDINFSLQDGELIGQCAGVVSVSPDPAGQWKIWMMRTWLEHYEGHGHPDFLDPVAQSSHINGVANGVTNGNLDQVYDVIIAGGGQGGLGLAGRLKALGVSYICFDNRPEIGDSWGHRYDSLKWHTIKQYGNLTFGRTFPEEDENLLPAKRIGAGYKAWSEKYGINAQPGTNVDSATWDERSQTWTVYTSGTQGKEEWKSKNLVLCIGPGHKSPVSPEWAAPENIKASRFKGSIVHAANYHNANAFAGKRGVVIGTANTAHDVAEDMANVGMDTTMVQRNPTFIFPGEWLVAYHGHDYHLDKPTDTADREQVTQPYKIQREMANRTIWSLIKAHPERFDALEEAGFKVDRYGDLFSNLYIRYGGHYVDIGSCARIVKGGIKMKTELVRELMEDGLRFEDGSEVGADLIVVCTGFEHDFRKDAAEVVGWGIAGQMEDFWGVDAEGELQGYARLAGRELFPIPIHMKFFQFADFYRSCFVLPRRRSKTVEVLF